MDGDEFFFFDWPEAYFPSYLALGGVVQVKHSGTYL